MSQYILSFDLELNQAPTGAKIIEIGACIGDVHTSTIIEEYTAVVNPNEVMEERIIKLTGITQEMVDAGVTLLAAYEGMIEMALRHKCMIMPLTWGSGDLHALKKELPDTATKHFGYRVVDVKTIYQSFRLHRRKNMQGGLANAMTKLGMNFKGKKHRACDDAKNTFLIFCDLIKRFS